MDAGAGAAAAAPRQQQGEPQATKAEATKSEATKSEAARPAGTKAETTKTEGPKPQGTKVEATKTEATTRAQATKTEATTRAQATKSEASKTPVAEGRGDAGAGGVGAVKSASSEEPQAPRTKIGDELLAETAQSKRGDAGVGKGESASEGAGAGPPEPERAGAVRVARSEPRPERESPIPGERLSIPGAQIGLQSARVRKFLESGGAALEARLVDIDTGSAIANADIEAWMGTKSVEAQSDAQGRFKIEGLVPGSRLMLWITAAPTYVQERTEVAVPAQGPEFQGTFKLLNRSAISGTVDGGAGLFLTRRASRTVVTGLAAFGPAERGGVRVGDAIVSVGKRKVGDLGPGAIDYLLRGPIGSQVEISVQTGSDPPRKIVLQRSAR